MNCFLKNDIDEDRFYKILSLKDEKKNTELHFANFSKCSLPTITRKIVEAVSTSLHVDPGLVLLGWLASVAGLDKGFHRVIHKNSGYINSLSLLILGGAESGCGKSSALEPFIECIKQIEYGYNSNKNSSNYSATSYDALNKRTKVLMDEYSKTGDFAKLDEIEDITQKLDKIEKERNKPKFIMSDITKAAYFKLMADQGFVMRMESDGILLPRDSFNMVRKFWGGEAHSENRISRGQTICNSPFIVDLVFTQIGPFTRFIKDKSYIETGLCARMLIYRVAKHDPQNYPTHQHGLDSEIKELIQKVLNRINDTAPPTIENTNKDITLTTEAECAWDKFRTECIEEASGRNAEIKEWANRMGQHALRIAGVLHVAEYSEPANEPISLEEIKTAIQITKILADNLWECVAGHTDRKERICMCDIGLHILQNNIRTFNATQIKQRFKDRYSASEVDVALYKLEKRYIVRDISEPFVRRRGRPSGHEYRNLYYEC